MKKTILITLFVMLIAGCSKITVQNNNPSIKNSLDSSNIDQFESNSNNFKTPRAIGRANSGQILIIPEESEKIEQLGAPSCLGEETDYSFKGKYKILFKDSENNITQISEYDGQIIAKDKTTFDLDKLSFNGFELFYFKPIPNLCRPDIVYIFGVTEDKKAFQFSFEYNDKTVKYLSSSPKTIPEVIDNMLVISTWEPEEGNYKEFFRPDIQKKIMEFVKKEKY